MKSNLVKNPLFWIIIALIVGLIIIIVNQKVKKDSITENDIMFCTDIQSCASSREELDCGADCRPGIIPSSKNIESTYCCLKNQDWERKGSGIGDGTYKEWQAPLVVIKQPNNNFIPDETWYTITKDKQRCTTKGYSCNIEGDVKRGTFVGEDRMTPEDCAKICKDDTKCLSFSANNEKGNCIFNYKGVCGSNNDPDAKYKLSASPMSRLYPEACTDGWRYYVKQPLSPDKI